MARLTDGEREVLAELNSDAAESWDGDEVEWCPGCHCPVSDCDCPAIAQMAAILQPRRRSDLWGDAA